MIAYFDTSALVKRLFDEQGSELADEVWSRATVVVSSELVYPEARAAAAAAQRAGRISAKGLRAAVRSIERMCDSVELLKVDTALVRAAGDLAEFHGLRGYDAVHLATALNISALRLVVATWDRDLAAASVENGVAVIPQAAFPAAAMAG